MSARRNRGTTIWFGEALEMFKRLHADKLSATIISERLNQAGFDVTRSAVIAKAKREGMSNGRRAGWKDARPQREPRARMRIVVTKPPPPPPPPIIRGERTGKLIDLDAHQCRFPVTGGRPPFMFCTEDKQDRSAYCERHHSIVYVKHTPFYK